MVYYYILVFRWYHLVFLPKIHIIILNTHLGMMTAPLNFTEKYLNIPR